MTSPLGIRSVCVSAGLLSLALQSQCFIANVSLYAVMAVGCTLLTQCATSRYRESEVSTVTGAFHRLIITAHIAAGYWVLHLMSNSITTKKAVSSVV